MLQFVLVIDEVLVFIELAISLVHFESSNIFLKGYSLEGKTAPKN